MVLKNMIVCFLWTVLAWTDSCGNFMLSLDSDSHVFCIIPEVAMLFMSARAIGWVMNNLFATIMTELILSVMLKNYRVSALVLVFSRTNGCDNLMLSFDGDSHVFCIVTKVAVFLVGSRSVCGVVNNLVATVFAEIVFSVMFKN
jgi:hypothetical protein